MPETGSQILNYQGNAALGSGSIPVINPDNNLNVINDAAKNIMLLNHDNNINLYNQKIRDRDATLQALQAGEISSGNIDPNDRPMYDRARNDVQNSFYDMVNNGGLNNEKAAKDYYDKVANLKNITDWAQNRELGLTQLQNERQQQVLPEDQKMYDDHIAQMKQQPFWNPITPVQKAFNYDINSATSNVLGQPTTVGAIGTTGTSSQATNQTTWNTTTNKNGVQTQKTTVKNAPVKTGIVNNKSAKQPITISGSNVNPDGSISPFSYTPEQYYDLGQIKKNVDENAATNPTDNYTYRQFLNDVQDPNKVPPQQQSALLASYNNRIADYSKQRGIAPIQGQTNPDGTPKYPDQINYHQNPDGSVLIQETPQSFFAKHALASVNGDYVQKPQQTFDKDLGNYAIQQQKAAVDSFYKHAMVNNANRRTQGYLDNLHQQMKLRGDPAEQNQFASDLYTRNLVKQPTLIQSTGKGNEFTIAPIMASSSLPVFTVNGNKAVQLQPIGAKAHNDDYGKFQYWEGGHYDPQYLINGSPLSHRQISDAYNRFKAQAGSSWQGGINEYMKEAVKRGLMDYSLIGANGSTDRKLSTAAQRLISNTTTKKGQTGVFQDSNPPTDDNADNSDNE